MPLILFRLNCDKLGAIQDIGGTYHDPNGLRLRSACGPKLETSRSQKAGMTSNAVRECNVQGAGTTALSSRMDVPPSCPLATELCA
jgi:hypothetical protein